MSSTHSKNEETLAVILEEINKKLDEEIKIRKAMQKEQEQKTKAILQKLSKLQEYNEINDMRAVKADPSELGYHAVQEAVNYVKLAGKEGGNLYR